MNTPQTLAEQVAARIAPAIRAEIEATGQPVTWETVTPVFQAVIHHLGVVSPSEERAAKIAARTAWAEAEGLGDGMKTRRVLDLSLTEWRTALRLNMIQPVPVPEPYRADGDPDGSQSGEWYPLVALTEAQRAEIAEQTWVRANEAALRWHMPLPQFRAERHKRGLAPVANDPHPWYRLSDVLRLAPKP